MLNNSKETYEEKFAHGYGLRYPDGHVIRFYERVLKRELNLDGSRGNNVLDFGCGTGVHSAFFQSKGFVPFGIDVSSHCCPK